MAIKTWINRIPIKKTDVNIYYQYLISEYLACERLTPNELYHGENMFIRWDDIRFILDKHAELEFYSAS